MNQNISHMYRDLNLFSCVKVEIISDKLRFFITLDAIKLKIC